MPVGQKRRILTSAWPKAPTPDLENRLDELQQLTKSSRSSPEVPATPQGGPPAIARRDQIQVAGTGFAVLFCIVGVALWGLPFYYDFMVQQFGWTRAQVTSGNALSKLAGRPLFGFLAGGWSTASVRAA